MNHNTNELEITILIRKFSITCKLLVILFYNYLFFHFMILGVCINLYLFLLFRVFSLEFWLVTILSLLKILTSLFN